MATKSYITYEPSSGSGDATVSVSAAEYTGRNQRVSVVLTVSGTGNGASATPKKVTVRQSGKPEFITRDQESVAIDNRTEEMTVYFTFTTNSSKFTISCPDPGTSGNALGLDASSFKYKKSDAQDDTYVGSGTAVADDPGSHSEFTLKVKGTIRPSAACAEGEEKICNVTLTDNAGHSETVRLVKSGAVPTISTSTDTITLDYTGAAKTFTITSNTTWSIS